MLFSSCSEIRVIWQLTKQKIVTDILDFHPVQIIRMLRLSHQVLLEEATGLPFIEETGPEPPLTERRVNPILRAGIGGSCTWVFIAQLNLLLIAQHLLPPLAPLREEISEILSYLYKFLQLQRGRAKILDRLSEFLWRGLNWRGIFRSLRI